MELYFSLKEIDKTAQQFWKTIAPHRVFAFHGLLGTGKTTFIAALCRAKGVIDLPSSPTFSLINAYELASDNGKRQQVYHMDLYRINDEEEAVQAGVEDCLLSNSLCLVEWPDKIPNLLPENTLHVHLSIEKDGKRKLVTEQSMSFS